MSIRRHSWVAAWPFVLLFLAAAVALVGPVSLTVADAPPFGRTADGTIWDSPAIPTPEACSSTEPGGLDGRSSAWERLACAPTDERVAGTAPASPPADPSLRPYPSRASPV